MTSFRSAKEKAGQRLGLQDHGALPSNVEVESALAERNRIFHAGSQEELLRLQRTAALAVMRALAPFSPRLVGPVLAGNATAHSVVELHAFSDEAEAIGATLEGLGLPSRAFEQRLRVRRDQTEAFPGYRFHTEHFDFTVVIFPERGRGNAPLSAVDGRPTRRATAKDVEALLGRVDAG